MTAALDNDFFHFHPSKPTSGTLPRDHDLIFTANGSIPEESPTDCKSMATDLENVATAESSYESDDDLPNGSATTSEILADKTSLEGIGAVSRSKSMHPLTILLIGIGVCVLLLSIVIAVWYEMDHSTLSYHQQDDDFTSENNDVPFNLTQNISNSSVKVVQKEEHLLTPGRG